MIAWVWMRYASVFVAGAMLGDFRKRDDFARSYNLGREHGRRDEHEKCRVLALLKRKVKIVYSE